MSSTHQLKHINSKWVVFFTFLSSIITLPLLPWGATAGTVACNDPFFGTCYGLLHTCPKSCSRLCEVDCRLCKPYCACDKPGAVCQDPRFIGGDGITFYFHGNKDKDFCLVTDSQIHINGHFIGKRSNKGRDFTWVQAVGILYGPHRLYIGARQVGKWESSLDNIVIHFNDDQVKIPAVKGQKWQPNPVAGLTIYRLADTNRVRVQVEGLLEIVATVVPITEEESRVHGYDVKEDDCFAHLELNFKFLSSLSDSVDGVLGQTYRDGYKSRVKMEAAMPIMGRADNFATSHLFAADCAVSNFVMNQFI
ncbi:hypothetical protein LINGRAHAP2_LOCUS9965 [Linum grandiflorum]